MLLVVLLVLLVLGASPGIARAPRAGAPGSQLDQCANRLGGTSAAVNDCRDAAWVSGNLNRNNSLYREGDFVPFRAVLTNLVSGDPYTLVFGYDALENGLHAYDYVGTYDASAHSGQEIVPCDGVANTAGAHPCGAGPVPGPPDTFPVPTDTNTTLPNGTHPPPSGHFSAWGAALTGADYVLDSPPISITRGTGTIERRIAVKFTANGPTVVLAWGGHIASVLDWGAGKTFIDAHSGSSFHMRLITLNGASTGHQDRSLDAAALAPVPTPFRTSVAPTSVVIGEQVVDTATLGEAPNQGPVEGDVRFFVCGPAASNPDCSSGGTEAFESPLKVLRTPVANGTASVGFTPTEPGHYCFRAEYTPAADSLYSPAVHTDTTTECFEAVLPPPMLTLTKICIPSAGNTDLFNFLLNNAQVGTDVACGQSTGPHVANVGSNTVSETAGTGTNINPYTTTVGGNCTNVGPRSGTIAFTANGESATCTITNQRSGPALATLTVNKECVPPTDPGRFGLTISSLPPFPDVPCGGSTGAVQLAPGTYTVSEGNGTGTDLADYTTANGCGTITLTAGQVASCTITNTRKPLPETLTVVKACRPVGDNGHFRVRIRTTEGLHPVARAVLACGGSLGPVHVDPGVSYTVDEAGANGTILAHYTHSFGDACAADGTVTVPDEPGAQLTCLITNERKSTPSARLSVIKICDPASDGGLFDITIAGQTARGVECGQTIGPVALAPGQHQVSESAGIGTSLSDYTTTIGGACAEDGSVTLVNGDNLTCEITNVRKDAPPLDAELSVTKICIPAGDPGRFNITIAGQTTPNVACGHGAGPVALAPGDYHVSESAGTGTSLSAYTTTIGGSCAANGSVTLIAGQVASCTITNVRNGAPSQPAVVKVIKICVPGSDGGRFNLTIDGQTAHDVACGGSFGPVVVAAGQHHVSESAGTGTSLSDYRTTIGGSCAANGSVTVAVGESAICTITNVRAGQETGSVDIVKRCSPAGVASRFQIEVDDHVFRGIKCGDSTGHVTLGVGDHQIGEVTTITNAARFRTTVSGDCLPSGSFTLNAGQHVTCTVTNTRVRPRPGPRPPRACYKLHVGRRMVTVGRRRVAARVHLFGRGVPGVRVYARGAGVSAVQTTGARGRTVFVLRLRRPGILRLNFRRPFHCPQPDPRTIGIHGLRQPLLTG